MVQKEMYLKGEKDTVKVTLVMESTLTKAIYLAWNWHEEWTMKQQSSFKRLQEYIVAWDKYFTAHSYPEFTMADLALCHRKSQADSAKALQLSR